MTLHVHEFLRRFLLDVLPPGFVRIRHFGFLSTRNRSGLLPLCFQLLESRPAQPVETTTANSQYQNRESWICPRCAGPMLIIERFTALQLRFRSPPHLIVAAA
jgi:hypothetical protein